MSNTKPWCTCDPVAVTAYVRLPGGVLMSASPRCGDCCDACGDCLLCYADDACAARGEGHAWVVRDEPAQAWLTEHPEARDL